MKSLLPMLLGQTHVIGDSIVDIVLRGFCGCCRCHYRRRRPTQSAPSADVSPPDCPLSVLSSLPTAAASAPPFVSVSVAALCRRSSSRCSSPSFSPSMGSPDLFSSSSCMSRGRDRKFSMEPGTILKGLGPDRYYCPVVSTSSSSVDEVAHSRQSSAWPVVVSIALDRCSGWGRARHPKVGGKNLCAQGVLVAVTIIIIVIIVSWACVSSPSCGLHALGADPIFTLDHSSRMYVAAACAACMRYVHTSSALTLDCLCCDCWMTRLLPGCSYNRQGFML